jgi:biotin carboxyl carrier protein
MRNFKVTVDGKVYDVTVEETGSSPSPKIVPLEQKTVSQPKPAAIEQKTLQPKPAAISGGTQLKSPMPGLILDFKVPEGAEVKKGQVIIILEAMKLENDIAAPCDGKVNFVTSKGANVDTNDILAVIS